MFSRAIVPFLVVFLCLPGLAQAQDIAVHIQDAYKAISTMQSDFSQVLRHKESGMVDNRTGTLRFKKPLLVRWEVNGDAPELLVIGASEVWNVFPDEEIAYRYSLDMVSNSNNIIQVITGQARLNEDFYYENEGLEDGLVKLRIFPKEPSQSIVEGLLWVDEKSGFIRKVIIYDFYANENEIVFTNQKTNISLPDSLFGYLPDKNFVVEDRRESGEPARQMLLQ